MNNQNNKQYSSTNKPVASFYKDLEHGEISFAGLNVDQYKYVPLYNKHDPSNAIERAVSHGRNPDEKYRIAKKCAILEGTKKTNIAIRLRAVVNERDSLKGENNAKNVEIGELKGNELKRKKEMKVLGKKLEKSVTKNAKQVQQIQTLNSRVDSFENNIPIVTLQQQLDAMKNASKDFNMLTGSLYAAITDINMILKHKNLGKIEFSRNNSAAPVEWIFNGQTHFLNGNKNGAIIDAVNDADAILPAADEEMVDVEPEESISQRMGRNQDKFSLLKFTQIKNQK